MAVGIDGDAEDVLDGPGDGCVKGDAIGWGNGNGCTFGPVVGLWDGATVGFLVGIVDGMKLGWNGAADG